MQMQLENSYVRNFKKIKCFMNINIETYHDNYKGEVVRTFTQTTIWHAYNNLVEV